MEFIGRLAALVPRPRVNLTRFHGVFSPNSKLRDKVVPSSAKTLPDHAQTTSKPYAMSWAQRLKRVFSIEIEKCVTCGGKLRVIASIEDPEVIAKILTHLGLDQPPERNRSPPITMPTDASTLF